MEERKEEQEEKEDKSNLICYIPDYIL